MPALAEALVDLDAVRHNVRRLHEIASSSTVMVVVKANAYGHGMLACAGAARDAGAGWLGVAHLDEALTLRRAGDRGRVLCWLLIPGQDVTEAVRADIDVTASSLEQLHEIAAGAAHAGGRARVQLKVDTGLSRNGCPPQEWPQLVAEAARLQASGAVHVVGVWSHLACADEPDHPANDAQERAFDEALAVVRASAGLEPELAHLANSPATLTRPTAHRDLVRVGLAAYGLSPVPQVGTPAQFGLRPALTLRSRLAAVRQVPAGTGVSYGHTFVATAPTVLGLVPVGYGDGIAISSSNRAEVSVGGRRCRLVGQVCMDQFVVDLGADGAAGAQPGDEVVLFGPGADGEPTVQDWADACQTNAYEVVTRLGGRLARVFAGSEA
jgi:alanine racemase